MPEILQSSFARTGIDAYMGIPKSHFKKAAVQAVVDYVSILCISIALFLLLPLPFDRPEDITQTRWVWFGGYHSFVEELFLSGPSETVTYMNKYHYNDALPLIGLALFSLTLGIAGHLIIQRIIGKASKIARRTRLRSEAQEKSMA